MTRLTLRRDPKLETIIPSLHNLSRIANGFIGMVFPEVEEARLYEPSGILLWRRKIVTPSFIDISPEGGIEAIGTEDGRIYVYDFKGLIRWSEELREHGSILSISISPKTRFVAIGLLSGELRVYDDTGILLWRGRHKVGFRRIEPVYSLSWSPDSMLLAVGSATKLCLYNIEEGNRLCTELGAPVSWISWSPSSNKLAVTLANGRMLVISSENLEVISTRSLCMKPYVSFWDNKGLIYVGTGLRTKIGETGSIMVFNEDLLELWSSGDLVEGPIKSIGPGSNNEVIAIPSTGKAVYVIL